jgi:hypothetical protein
MQNNSKNMSEEIKKMNDFIDRKLDESISEKVEQINLRIIRLKLIGENADMQDEKKPLDDFIANNPGKYPKTEQLLEYLNIMLKMTNEEFQAIYQDIKISRG